LVPLYLSLLFLPFSHLLRATSSPSLPPFLPPSHRPYPPLAARLGLSGLPHHTLSSLPPFLTPSLDPREKAAVLMKVLDGLLAPEWRRKGDIWRRDGGEMEGERRRREVREKWEEDLHGVRQEAARLAVREGQREREMEREEETQQPQQSSFPSSSSSSPPSTSTFLQEPLPPSLPPSLAVFQNPLRQMQLVLGRPPSVEDLPWLDASGLLSPPPSLPPSPTPSLVRLFFPPPSPPPSPPSSLEGWLDLWVCRYWIEAERTYEARHPPSLIRRREERRGRVLSLREWREEEERERERRGGGGRRGWGGSWRRGRVGRREGGRESEMKAGGGATHPRVQRNEDSVSEKKEEEGEGGERGGGERERRAGGRYPLQKQAENLTINFPFFSY